MNNHDPMQDYDLLGERLRREAEQSRPEFSPRLHTELLLAVRAATEPELRIRNGRPRVDAPARFGGRLLAWTARAVAAIILAAGLAVIWHGVRPERPLHETIAATPPLQSPHDKSAKAGADDFDAATSEVVETTAKMQDWFAAAVGDNQWAGLDRDAQSAIAAVTAPLPVDFSLALADSEANE